MTTKERLEMLDHKDVDDMTEEEMDFYIRETRAEMGLLS